MLSLWKKNIYNYCRANYTLDGLIAYCSEFTTVGIQYLVLYGLRRTVTFTEFHR